MEIDFSGSVGHDKEDDLIEASGFEYAILQQSRIFGQEAGDLLELEGLGDILKGKGGMEGVERVGVAAETALRLPEFGLNGRKVLFRSLAAEEEGVELVSLALELPKL